MADSAYRARSSFAVPGPGGVARVVQEGDIVKAGDPVVKTNREAFQSMTEYVEQTTQAPGEKREGVRFPSGVTYEEAVKARDVRVGPRNKGDAEVPHVLPPEHEDSPASTFAPVQPAAGVVADDVEAKGQNVAGGPTASAATKKKLGADFAEKQAKATEKADAPGEKNAPSKSGK